MRDIILVVVVIGLCGLSMRRPFYGVLLITWLGHMSPQTFTWGFSKTLPFVAMAVICTMVGLLMTKDRTSPPNNTCLWILIVFILWVSLSTIFALYPEQTDEYSRFIKIQFTVLLILILVKKKEEIIALITTIAFSIGFFGIKGGLFTVATAGSYRVWGPDGTFIGGNNEIALALMVVPFFYFLSGSFENKRLKQFLVACLILCVISSIGSQSRGAFLALIATSCFLWTKSSNKGMLAFLALILIIFGSFFIPEAWFSRMETIETYDEDASAITRINSWLTSINVAKAFFFGGGFGMFNKQTFILYAPNPEFVFDAHSIYFEILGEQGFGGLLIFISMFLSTWLLNNKTSNLAKDHQGLKWASNLALMINVSFVAYASGGAFLGLAYWDLPYQLVAISAILNSVVINSDEIKKKTINKIEKQLITTHTQRDQ